MAIIQSNPRCHYSGKPYPVPLADSSQRWLKVYTSCKAEVAFWHAKNTVDLAIDYGIIEPDKICDRKADQLQLNLKAAQVGFVHMFRDTPENRKRFPEEDFARHPLIVTGFETFDKLRTNDLGSQDRKVYAQLLEKPSLGTIVRLPDLMQYHGYKGPVSGKTLAKLDPETFYFFQTDRGMDEYVRIAHAAHKVYVPLAEFFGYTKQLAGDLDQMAYYHLNRKLHDRVLESLRFIRQQIKATNRIMNTVVAQLGNLLRTDGYDFDIIVRDHKHEGRVMEKVDRKLREGILCKLEHRDSSSHIANLIAELKDLAAFTVVLHAHNDRIISQKDLVHFNKVAKLIIDLTGGLQPSPDVESKNFISVPKPNGYQSLHVDFMFTGPGLVCMEALIRNTHMHHMATDGGAAHYLYKGGGPELLAIQNAYNNVKDAILERLNGKSK
jgi:hypothetical protein